MLGKIVWFPTTEETLHYNPAVSPTLYAVAHISSLSSALDLFITEIIIQLRCTHTNLYERWRHEGWRGFEGCGLSGEESLHRNSDSGWYLMLKTWSSMWLVGWQDKTGHISCYGAIFRSALTSALMTGSPVQATAGMISLLRLASCGKSGLLVFTCCSIKGLMRVDEQLVALKGHCGLTLYSLKACKINH